jgi:hypothetical protein
MQISKECLLELGDKLSELLIEVWATLGYVDRDTREERIWNARFGLLVKMLQAVEGLEGMIDRFNSIEEGE